MPYARIYITKQRRQQDVDVKEILNFWTIYSSGGDPTKKAFQLIGTKGQLIDCQVLRIAETLDILHEKISAKRSHVPKLNASLFEQNNNVDMKQTIMNMKKRKVKQITGKTSAKLETAGNIINAYRKASETNMNGTSKKRKQELAVNPKETKTVKRLTTENASDSCSSESATENFEQASYTIDDDYTDDISQNKEPYAIREEVLPSRDLDKCNRNIEELENEVTCWKNLYEELKNSKQYPLTEETGRQILAVLNGGPSRSASTVGEKDSKSPSLEDTMDLGNGFTMKQSVYDSFAKQSEPSKFLSSLAQCVWGVETLAKRCVRRQANVKELQLEDDKKGIVIKHFQDWLIRASYPPHLITRELGKLNKYFNAAITGARKKMKRIADIESLDERNDETIERRFEEENEEVTVDKTKRIAVLSEKGKTQSSSSSKKSTPRGSKWDTEGKAMQTKLQNTGHVFKSAVPESVSYDSDQTVFAPDFDTSVSDDMLCNIHASLKRCKSQSLIFPRRITVGGSKSDTNRKAFQKKLPNIEHVPDSSPSEEIAYINIHKENLDEAFLHLDAPYDDDDYEDGPGSDET